MTLAVCDEPTLILRGLFTPSNYMPKGISRVTFSIAYQEQIKKNHQIASLAIRRTSRLAVGICHIGDVSQSTSQPQPTDQCHSECIQFGRKCVNWVYFVSVAL